MTVDTECLVVVVDFYAGTESPKEAVFSTFLERVYHPKYISVEHNETFEPDICKDVCSWTDADTDRYLLNKYPNAGIITTGSPPCTEYSAAKTSGIRHFKEADMNVLAYMKITDYIAEKGRLIQSFMENPSEKRARGYNPFALSLRPFMQEYQIEPSDADEDDNDDKWIKTDVSYCCYGTFYCKYTNIWMRYKQDFVPETCPGDLICWAAQIPEGEDLRRRHMSLTELTVAERGTIPINLWQQLLRGALPLMRRYSANRILPRRRQGVVLNPPAIGLTNPILQAPVRSESNMDVEEDSERGDEADGVPEVSAMESEEEDMPDGDEDAEDEIRDVSNTNSQEDDSDDDSDEDDEEDMHSEENSDEDDEVEDMPDVDQPVLQLNISKEKRMVTKSQPSNSTYVGFDS